MNKRLFVFDLDFTIWDAGGTWCDATDPPYQIKNGEIYDRAGRCILLYPDVREILELIKRSDRFIAAASRTFEPDWANELLKLLDIDNYFDYKEIYPSSKIKHFRKLQQKYLLLDIIKRGKFEYFGIYCLLVGAAALIYFIR